MRRDERILALASRADNASHDAECALKCVRDAAERERIEARIRNLQARVTRLCEAVFP